MSIVLSREEVAELTGYKRPTEQFTAVTKLGIKCWLQTTNGRRRVVVPRLAYELWKNPPPPQPPEPEMDPEWRVQPPPRVPWSETPLGRMQAKEREFRASREAAREASQKEYEAYLEATRPEREAQARLNRAALVRYHANKRRVMKLQRTPQWADQTAIRAVYLEAQRLTEVTGISHHVDHVIPLQGKRVSGLHVETNLQILTGSENSRKKNSYEVEA